MINIWRKRRINDVVGEAVGGLAPGPPSGWANDYSVVFDGVNENATGSYAMTGSTSGFPMGVASGSFSLSLWCYASGVAPNTWNGGSSNTMIGVGNQGSGAGARMLSWAFKTRDSNGQTLEWAFTNAALPNNLNIVYRVLSPPVFTWNHFLLVYDGAALTNEEMSKVWVNGEQQVSATFIGTMPATLNTSTWPLSFGAQAAGRYGAVVLDEVSVYNAALTGTHATALYNAGTPVDSTAATGSSNLVHYWRMGDAASFPIIPDQITSFPGVSPMDLGMNNMEAGDITGSVAPAGTITW